MFIFDIKVKRHPLLVPILVGAAAFHKMSNDESDQLLLGGNMHSTSFMCIKWILSREADLVAGVKEMIHGST